MTAAALNPNFAGRAMATRPPEVSAAAAEPGAALATLTDEALIASVRDGSHEAFAELDRRLRPRLVAALHRRLRRRDDCEDVAQQALFNAYRQVHRYDPTWRVTTWVFTIAFRLAIDLQRADRRAAATLERAEPPASDDRTPWHDAARAELRDNLWAAADEALDDTAYTILWLRFGEGLEPSEIAKILGKTAVHVRVLQHRAVARLRQHLQATGLEHEVNHA